MRTRPLGAALCCLAGTLACTRAEFRELSPAAFPFAIDSIRTRALSGGARHHFLYAASGPWAVHVLEVRIDGCQAVAALKGARGATGRTKTSELLRARAESVHVVGGVNADFFAPQGVPTGAHVEAGRVVTPPSRHFTLATDSAGRPHIVTFTRATRDSLALDDPRLAGLSLLPFHPMEAVGGRGRIVGDSAITDVVDTIGGAPFAARRHPRTAVGIADRGRRLILVVVDGRQAPYSDGMTLRELAQLLRALGAREAINLDGGGSTTMVVADPAAGDSLRVVNRPSDPTGERAVGNAVAIVRRCEAGER